MTSKEHRRRPCQTSMNALTKTIRRLLRHRRTQSHKTIHLNRSPTRILRKAIVTDVFSAIRNAKLVRDIKVNLHATILHLMGLDHKKLTYRYNGRDFRLTDVAGNVVKEVLV
jgi:hypothetical protein